MAPSVEPFWGPLSNRLAVELVSKLALMGSFHEFMYGYCRVVAWVVIRGDGHTQQLRKDKTSKMASSSGCARHVLISDRVGVLKTIIFSRKSFLSLDPPWSAYYAHAAYRLGHML